MKHPPFTWLKLIVQLDRRIWIHIMPRFLPIHLYHPPYTIYLGILAFTRQSLLLETGSFSPRGPESGHSPRFTASSINRNTCSSHRCQSDLSLHSWSGHNQTIRDLQCSGSQSCFGRSQCHGDTDRYQIADRLCASIGQDILDCLFSRSTILYLSHRKPVSPQTARPFFFFTLSVIYVGKCTSITSPFCLKYIRSRAHPRHGLPDHFP